MPISCHFWDSKVFLATSLYHVRSAISQVLDFTFTFTAQLLLPYCSSALAVCCMLLCLSRCCSLGKLMIKLMMIMMMLLCVYVCVWWYRWRLNMKYAQYARRRHHVKVTLISAVPCYGASILQLSRFCQEILNLQLLPICSR